MPRILIVDDDPRTLDVLDLSLRFDGHETIRATDGAEALKLASDHQPDAIILDQMMPHLDGLEVTRRLRTDPTLSRTPIVMATAKVLDSDVWEGWCAGVDSYVTKPLDLTLLRKELVRLGLAAGTPTEVS